MIRRILIAVGIVVFIGISGFTVYIALSGPTLPQNTNEIITQVLGSELPELIKGETGYAQSGEVRIWYESIEPEGTPKGAVLLLTGISSDAIAWPPKFLGALVNAGYQVIRYDHRGTGMSDWVENWDQNYPYSLEDMADDGIAVLDTLEVKEAHVIGVSMGGMIAQQVAIDHPDRVQSLTSIMSSGYIVDPELPPVSIDTAKELIEISFKYGLIKSERNTIKLHVASRLILMGDSFYSIDVKTISEQVLYNLRMREGYNPQASTQHNAAVYASGSRYDNLLILDKPTLIIHGQSDPFIPIEHGMKCADLIPYADKLWIEGMGHDLPDKYLNEVVEKILLHFQQTE